MVPPVTDDDLAENGPLAGWRVEGDRLVVRFRAASFADAGRFVAEVAAVADELDHHPDLAVAYPGVVDVSMTSHDVGRLTGRDRRLAMRVTALAAGAGLMVTP